MLVDELVAHFTPLLDEKGFELCEVTFESQKGEKTLHFAIDKKEGIMDLEATVQLSEFISEELDRLNFSDDSYTLDVSSPGAAGGRRVCRGHSGKRREPASASARADERPPGAPRRGGVFARAG